MGYNVSIGICLIFFELAHKEINKQNKSVSSLSV